MSKDLLAKRYLVIALWPNHDEGLSIGTVIPAQSDGSFYIGNHTWYVSKLMNDFPNLFRELQWWEQRDEKDMPEFVKHIESGKIARLINRSFDDFLRTGLDVPNEHAQYFLPATESEYSLELVHAIDNDNKCTKITANKFLDKMQPRIEFVLKTAIKEQAEINY